MKTLWRLLGQSAYWLSLPALWLYLRRSQRTRVGVVCGNEILVVRGWLGNGQWTLPGGGRHSDEPANCGAVRELFEEVGIRATTDKLVLLRSFTVVEPFRYSCDLFSIRLVSKPELHLQRFEILEAQWVSLPDVTQLKRSYELDILVDALATNGLVTADLLQ